MTTPVVPPVPRAALAITLSSAAVLLGIVILVVLALRPPRTATDPASAASIHLAAPLADSPGMVVGGTATLEAVPDVADVRASLAIEAPTPQLATRQLREQQSAAAGALTAAGIPSTDVSLSQLGLDPVHHRETGKVLRYRAAIDLTVTTRDFERLPVLLETLAQHGATSMATSFRVSDLPALKAKVRRQAATAAQAKANDLAKALGISLGAVRAVSESPGDGWTWNGSYANFVMTENVPTTGTHGKLQPISLTINVTYDLKPDR